MMITQILAAIGQIAINITQTLGYPGLAFLMTLESMVVPLPSELVLPFAGFLIAGGRFNFALAIIAATIGSLIGSLLSYAMGYYGGDSFVRRLGRYCFLDEADLSKTENWFKQRGELTIFIARFVPVVRHLISIPAGIGKMDLKRFSLYTLAGAALWNSLLLVAGYLLGANWPLIRNYSEYFSLAIALSLAVAGAILLWRHIKNHQ